MLGAIGATVALVSATASDLPLQLSVFVYGLSMVMVFGVSAVYHLGRWRRRRGLVRALDHATIFVMIAGTYTPICVNVLSGWSRSVTLVLIWSLAVAGVISSVVTVAWPRWATVGLYLAMGWAAILPAPSLVRSLPPPALMVFAGGGLLYTLGAVVYARRRPDPFPRVFGFHEVFHLLVIGGTTAFLVGIWSWVLPFPRI